MMAQNSNRNRIVFFVLGAIAFCFMVYHIGLETIVSNVRKT